MDTELKTIVKSIRQFSKESAKYDKPCILAIAKLLKEEKYKEAYEEFKHADTFVRDGFPADVRRFIRIKASDNLIKVTINVDVDGKHYTFYDSVPDNMKVHEYYYLNESYEKQIIEKFLKIKIDYDKQPNKD